MRILIADECNRAEYTCQMHEAFRTGLRRLFDTKAFGRGYPDWRPELGTFPEIVAGLYGDERPDVILPAYQLSADLGQLRFFQPGLEAVPAAKAIVLSDFWSVTDHYPEAFLDWLDRHGITWVLCYYPRPVELF